MADNVVVMKFPESAQAYQQLSKLKQNANVRSAGVVEVDEDHVPELKDGFDREAGSGTTTGGLIGMAVGILGGPLGMLLGWGTGSMIGATRELDKASDATGVVAMIAAQLPPGSTALIVHVDEGDESILDLQAEDAGATIERAASEDMLNDLYAAEEQAEAEEKALKEEEKEAKKAARKGKVEARIEEFAAKR